MTSTIIYHHLPSSTIIYHHLPSSTLIYHHLPNMAFIMTLSAMSPTVTCITFITYHTSWPFCNMAQHGATDGNEVFCFRFFGAELSLNSLVFRREPKKLNWGSSSLAAKLSCFTLSSLVLAERWVKEWRLVRSGYGYRLSIVVGKRGFGWPALRWCWTFFHHRLSQGTYFVRLVPTEAEAADINWRWAHIFDRNGWTTCVVRMLRSVLSRASETRFGLGRVRLSSKKCKASRRILKECWTLPMK